MITGSDSMLDFTRFITQSTAWFSCAADYNASGFLTEVKLHNVTVQTTVPALATLQTYDQVWDMRFSAANCQGTVAACGTNGISATEQANYLSYIANGGSLFLMGDNGGYPGRNNPILAIANAVDSAHTFQTSGVLTNNDTQQGAYVNIAAATAAENFQSDYRDLTGTNRWIASQYNGLIQNWGNGYPVLRDNLTSDATAIAFDCANMDPAYKAGKLMVVFDWQMMGGGGQVAYCGPPTYTGTTTGYNERFWENSIDFLVKGNVCTSPTPTPTKSSTSTSTFTRTASQTTTASPTPSLTQTPTSSRTASQTPTLISTSTMTSTLTSSSTSSSTRSPSPSVTSTRTLTSTSTITSLNTATHTPTITVTSTSTSTRTASATITYSATQTLSSTSTSTRTVSNTLTLTQTVSPIASNTFSPTVTPTATPSSTRTNSATVTVTYTSTSTITETIAFSATNTRTHSETVTQSLTLSSTSTRTASPSLTVTRTLTQTRSMTSTRTPSLTVTDSPTLPPTPVPMPFHINLRVYNSAGEEVGILYEGGITELPNDIQLDQKIFYPGDQLGIHFNGKLANNLSVVYWEGRNSYTQDVSAGTYYVKMDITDPFGKVSSYTKSVQVAPAKSVRSLSVYNSAGELVWQKLLTGDMQKMTLRSEAFAPQIDPSSGLVTNPLRMDFKDSLGGTYTQYWDGRNQEGQLVDAGTYTIKLTQSRPGSQPSVEMASVSLLRGDDKSSFEKSILSPNPATGKQITITYKPIANQLVGASVFNLAGERVANGIDYYASGKVTVDISKLVSGIYVVDLSCNQDRKLLKLSVVH